MRIQCWQASFPCSSALGLSPAHQPVYTTTGTCQAMQLARQGHWSTDEQAGPLKTPGTHSFPRTQPFTPESPGPGHTHQCASAKSLHSCRTRCKLTDCSPPGSSVHGDSLGKTTGVCCHALLQGIFATRGSNLSLLHCRWILYR